MWETIASAKEYSLAVRAKDKGQLLFALQLLVLLSQLSHTKGGRSGMMGRGGDQNIYLFLIKYPLILPPSNIKGK